jgi:hypothetical protein
MRGQESAQAMCRIAAIWYEISAEQAEISPRTMSDAQCHRGPDGCRSVVVQATQSKFGRKD